MKVAPDVLTIEMPKGNPARYIRLDRGTIEPTEVQGFRDGTAVDRQGWKATNLFDSYAARTATAAWQATIA